MAGGIDWFRWHHGTVSDLKFPLVARQSGSCVAEVVAVWACLLESASMNADERGMLSGLPDFDALDCALGMPDGRCAAIFQSLRARGLIDEHLHIVAWQKRQPKREREDDTAAERKRRQRERDADDGVSGDVTPRHTTSHQKKPRGEESREEGIEEANASSRRQRKADDLPDCPYQSIVDLYAQKLPELPQVRVMDEKRKRCIKTFWCWVFTARRSDGQVRAQTADQALTWIGQYFDRAAANDFVMGRTGRSGEHQNWRADIEYLCGERGRKQVIERTVEA
jgi:hypothetical protein